MDRSLIQKAIQIYVEMGMGSSKPYQIEFERPFLESSKEYFSKESTLWIQSSHLTDYLIKAEMRFIQEKKRVREYLCPMTEIPLLNVSTKASHYCVENLLSVAHF